MPILNKVFRIKLECKKENRIDFYPDDPFFVNYKKNGLQ